jgi:hypothetical protein
MRAGKQRNVDNDCRNFSRMWEEDCFFTDVGLICGDTDSELKVFKLERCFVSKHEGYCKTFSSHAKGRKIKNWCRT